MRQDATSSLFLLCRPDAVLHPQGSAHGFLAVKTLDGDNRRNRRRDADRPWRPGDITRNFPISSATLPR
jgi:hypothetical protein